MKKVCFIGRGESWKLAPFFDEEYEIWSLVDCYTFIPRADRWFEIHLESVYNNLKPRGAEDKNHLEQLNKLNIPVYMINIHPKVKKSIKYPIKKMKKKYPNWWVNSLCFMFALAVEEGFEEIHIYGVDMANPDEFQHEIPGMAKWIGYSEARGIKVIIPNESILKNHNYIYGFQEITKEVRRKSSLRCKAFEIPGILKWCNENLPKIYLENKQKIDFIDIKFTKK